MSKKILKVSEVVKDLSGREVLHTISFDVGAWEIYGFLGPNGAGKTTTLKCIMWLITPESWEISLLWDTTLSIKTKSQIGFMPEKPNVIDHINRNRCDNRKSNLRIVDFSINGFLIFLIIYLLNSHFYEHFLNY